MTTPDELVGEALEIWQADRRSRLTENLLAHRPAEFAAPGNLDLELDGWARQIAAGNPRNLVLTGGVGAGKTWSVWHAAETAIRAGYEGGVTVTTAARLRRVCAPATADSAELGRYTTAGLLILDDLGAFRLSEWDLDHLGELTDERWAEHRPTAITSNKTDIRSLLGPRISSRLQHNALILELDGPDRRRQQP
jgi:DNA replication protein DnaC